MINLREQHEGFLLNMKVNKDWWSTAFDKKYLDTYVDTVSEVRTKKEVAFLKKQLKLKRGMKVLDLACGYGRHAIPLALLGVKVEGVDSSKYFIAKAKREAHQRHASASFKIGDMRTFEYPFQFDAIILMFSSFGYFQKKTDDQKVLRRISHSLKPGGYAFFDLNNPTRLLTALSQNTEGASVRSVTLSNGLEVSTKQKLNPTTLRWEMHRSWKHRGKVYSYKTRVQLYKLADFKKMLQTAGLRVTQVCGDFTGEKYGVNTRRMLVLVQKV